MDEGYPMNYGVLVVTQLAWKQYTIVLPLNHQGELVMNPIAEKIKHSKTKSTSIPKTVLFETSKKEPSKPVLAAQ